MRRIDITADLIDEDDTAFVWTFLDEAREPASITLGALVVAGDEEATGVCQVVDLVAGEQPRGVGAAQVVQPFVDALLNARLVDAEIVATRLLTVSERFRPGAERAQQWLSAQ